MNERVMVRRMETAIMEYSYGLIADYAELVRRLRDIGREYNER